MGARFKPMLAVLLGSLAGALVIFLGEMASGLLIHEDPATFEDPTKLEAFMRSAPVGLFLTVLAAYAAGAFVAGFVTNWRARAMGIPYRPALISGVALMVMGILNMCSFWHPVWFWVVSLPTYLGFAWLGGRMVKG